MKHTIVVLIFSTVINLLSLSGGRIFAGTVEQAVSERTKPIGSLCMAGDTCAAVARPESRSLVLGERTGKEIYDTKCMMCHASGAGGAPIVGTNDTSNKAWTPRINKGIETLFANSIAGINGMPAKGLCNDCSDNEIKATVCYMVDTAIPDDEKTDEIRAQCATIKDAI